MPAMQDTMGKAHAPNSKALRKYCLSQLIKSLLQAVSWVTFLWMGYLLGLKQTLDNIYKWAMVISAAFLAIMALFRCFVTMYQMRGSMLYTSPGYVMYVIRVWHPFSAVHYTAYRIDHIRDYCQEDNAIPSLIKGKIQTVNLDESGLPLSTPRLCRKVKLLPVFEDKEEIYTAFKKIQSATDQAEGRALLSWLNDHADYHADGGQE